MGRRPYLWLKLWPDILRNPKIRGLTNQQFVDWIYSLCHASEQKKRWQFSDERTASKIIGIPIQRFRKLIELGLFDRGKTARFILVGRPGGEMGDNRGPRSPGGD